MTEKFEAINWNKIPNRVDYSAWSRLNDFIWEPERIPVSEDKPDFKQLSPEIQDAFLKALASLAFMSTIQVKIGDSAVKKDAVTPQEYSVFNALNYLESIANKGYSNLIQALANPLKINSYFDWANDQDELQTLAHKLIDIYENGAAWQKKIVLSFTEMAFYHIGFYGPTYLFGQGKLVRSAELLKLAVRSTSFNAMYPGVKFRLETADKPADEQKNFETWTNDFIKEIAPVMEKHIDKLYGKLGSTDDAKHYFHYTINKNFMNLGYPTPYPEDTDSLSETIQKGLIKSANFEDFFFYSNANTLTKFHENK
ncbi:MULTISPECIES: ribonucleotide-diphosphate reductase subunit beta [Lactobacillus]|uniref:ribonucleoside-diphosphate reductase n=1 Tax=Lactobacillus xujianguonis TaxID=2495899 RepID=A0A437SVK8_9LACO|nr:MULTISPECIES: ribonucleotide-diphosphate reductase subunit beta [Lactobacillus]RVU70922.1 ribonucleotide-diphosphate reductase subunit beta [Lactobacillus xujianguonis]RVU73554.1 ribonucleotide-diphosphate reductase subunit beta [Lactobacillus xujianguonis]